MPSLLVQFQELESRIREVALAPAQGFTPIEPRSVRRAKARDAAKASEPTRSRTVSNNSIKQN